MPQRQVIITVQSDAVQGPDSWVKVRALSHREAKDLQLLHESGDEEKMETVGQKTLADHIFDWNWVDDAGEPLPLPKTNPAMLDDLLQRELTFLSNALSDTVRAPKNS